MTLVKFRLRSVLCAICGALVLWLSLGNVIGTYLAVSYPGGHSESGEHRCVPYGSVFGVIETDCDSALVRAAWATAIEIPRMMIVPAALAQAFIRASVKNGFNVYYLLEALWWTLLSIPLLTIVVFGFRFWRSWSPLSAFAIILPLLYVLVDLGIHE